MLFVVSVTELFRGMVKESHINRDKGASLRNGLFISLSFVLEFEQFL